MLYLLFFCWYYIANMAHISPPASDTLGVDSFPSHTSAEDALNLYCLRAAYPMVHSIQQDATGAQWLVFSNGQQVLYSRAQTEPWVDPWSVDVRTSMADPYPLEPERPATPEGFAPGRRRSYALLEILFGANATEVGKKLHTVDLLGQPICMTKAAALALQKVEPLLAESLRQEPELRRLLKSDGGFFWRRIAGEQRLSPHSYGIALDLSADLATYWRWCPLRPHPMQQSYPSAIVTAFESQGFIWGGKWHEYDLMHFEYRPEIICKAKLLRKIKKGHK